MILVSRFFALRSGQIALAVTAIVALVLSCLPLLGIPGPESALVLGIVLPPFCAAAGAARVAQTRARRSSAAVFTTLVHAMASGAIVVFFAYIILALNSLRVGACAPGLGAMFIALGPGLGCVLASAVGAAWGFALVRRRVAITIAALTPVVAILWSVERLWHSPAIFAYGHFFGYFPGTLYDEDIALSAQYFTLRALTLFFLAAIAFMCTALVDPLAQRLRVGRLPRYLARVLAGILCVYVVVYGETHRGELSLGSDVAVMKERLGAVERGSRCEVVAPRELGAQARHRLVEDCDFRIRQTEQLLGVHQRARVTAFFFRDANEKRLLMGAGDTYIAKPWRNEVYLQVSDWPHPVLAHEIAHVVAGNLAPGPLHVPGRFFGVLPEAGMIEGVAVALAWDEREGLTPHEWTRAMMELGNAPSLNDAMGTSFMLAPARNAYAAAGSFYRFLFTQYGAAVVRRAYASGDVLHATGRTLAQLEHEWRTYLGEVQLSNDALELARVRFARNAIFARVCPHVVADLHMELAGDMAAGDISKAIRTCRDVLRVDGGDIGVRAIEVSLLARSGDIDGAKQLFATLERMRAPLPTMASASESIADAYWKRGDTQHALQIYASLLDAPRSDDQKRVLEVKVLALTLGGAQSRAVYALLVGESTRPVDRAFAVHLAHQIAQEREDGLGEYLEARQLVNEAHFAEAHALLGAAIELGMPTIRLQREATRLYGQSAFATGRHTVSENVWRSITNDATASEGARVEARDWLDRVHDHARSSRSALTP